MSIPNPEVVVESVDTLTNQQFQKTITDYVHTHQWPVLLLLWQQPPTQARMIRHATYLLCKAISQGEQNFTTALLASLRDPAIQADLIMSLREVNHNQIFASLYLAKHKDPVKGLEKSSHPLKSTLLHPQFADQKMHERVIKEVLAKEMPGASLLAFKDIHGVKEVGKQCLRHDARFKRGTATQALLSICSEEERRQWWEQLSSQRKEMLQSICSSQTPLLSAFLLEGAISNQNPQAPSMQKKKM